jgi:hypothetical protein
MQTSNDKKREVGLFQQSLHYAEPFRIQWLAANGLARPTIRMLFDRHLPFAFRRDLYGIAIAFPAQRDGVELPLDRLEAASMYQRSEVASRVNITNIRGVTVVGNGNVVNTTFTDLSRVLNDLKQAILQEPTLSDDRKPDIAADVDSLEAQLQKPEPKKSIVQMLWSGIEKAACGRRRNRHP